MNAYPPQLIQAAKNLLDNQDFTMLLQHKVKELREDVEMSTETNDILRAHTELNNVKDFAQWIEHIGEERLT